MKYKYVRDYEYTIFIRRYPQPCDSLRRGHLGHCAGWGFELLACLPARLANSRRPMQNSRKCRRHQMNLGLPAVLRFPRAEIRKPCRNRTMSPPPHRTPPCSLRLWLWTVAALIADGRGRRRDAVADPRCPSPDGSGDGVMPPLRRGRLARRSSKKYKRIPQYKGMFRKWTVVISRPSMPLGIEPSPGGAGLIGVVFALPFLWFCAGERRRASLSPDSRWRFCAVRAARLRRLVDARRSGLATSRRGGAGVALRAYPAHATATLGTDLWTPEGLRPGARAILAFDGKRRRSRRPDLRWSSLRSAWAVWSRAFAPASSTTLGRSMDGHFIPPPTI